jgi:transcriptional regulator with PAS, ATPase and Fis domain
VSQAVMLRLMAHDFPGNVRELENIIEHAFSRLNRHLPMVEAEKGNFYDFIQVIR